MLSLVIFCAILQYLPFTNGLSDHFDWDVQCVEFWSSCFAVDHRSHRTETTETKKPATADRRSDGAAPSIPGAEPQPYELYVNAEWLHSWHLPDCLFFGTLAVAMLSI